ARFRGLDGLTMFAPIFDVAGLELVDLPGADSVVFLVPSHCCVEIAHDDSDLHRLGKNRFMHLGTLNAAGAGRQDSFYCFSSIAVLVLGSRAVSGEDSSSGASPWAMRYSSRSMAALAASLWPAAL